MAFGGNESRHPFSYVEYDPHDDAVSVGVGGLDRKYPVTLRHVVEHPQNVFVPTSAADSVIIEVTSSNGTVTLITLVSRCRNVRALRWTHDSRTMRRQRAEAVTMTEQAAVIAKMAITKTGRREIPRTP